MQCLDKCQNSVLDFFVKEGGKGVPLYRCAQDQAGTYNPGEVADACADLEHLGLLRNIGTAGKVLKLSASAVGDVRSGYFSQQGSGGDGLAAMQKKLLALEKKHEAAAENVDRLDRKVGGLAKDKN